MKKLIAFDLDGTLAPSKSFLPDEMAEAFGALLKHFKVCVISGGKFGQFETQLLNGLHADAEQLQQLHLMPTCGTRYLDYDAEKEQWHQVYAEDFTDAQKQQILKELEAGIDHFDYREKETYGDIIEDRGSQITFSALGQEVVSQLGQAGVELKERWDPDNAKKNKLRDYLADRLPDFEVRVGGGTSIDITKPGIDKAYGMNKLIELLNVTKEDILFMGDRIQPGGNDFPVKEMGIDCIEVSDWQNTVQIIRGIVHVC